MMNKLWYRDYAKNWFDCLPLGNGKIGVMLDGKPDCETLMFNDDTLWSGYPKDYTNPNSLKNLNTLRKMIFDGKRNEADKFCSETSLGDWSESYLPLGNLILNFKHIDNPLNYSRQLDLENALYKVHYRDNWIKYDRECFASYPDNVVVYKLSCWEKFLDVEFTANSQLQYNVVTEDNSINIIGEAPSINLPNYVQTEHHTFYEGKGMSFALRAEIFSDGEIMRYSDSIRVKNAKFITVYITTATGFLDYCKNPITDTDYSLNICKEHLKNIDKNYDLILARHISDYQNLYNRVKFKITNESNSIPTDTLVNNAVNIYTDKRLVELLYNFGRYITIASSRKGTQATNLQGIWNKDLLPLWSSNYTLNINTQMNYWGVESANLQECEEPYWELMKRLCERGKKTAQINYGCAGSSCNHNSDIWAMTTPIKPDPLYSYAPLNGAWLAFEMYKHYTYDKTKERLKFIAPIIEEFARFASDWLVEYNGNLVTCPATSPEVYYYKDNKIAALAYATACDINIVWQIFSAYEDIANETIVDNDLLTKIKEQKIKLKPLAKSKSGLLEWDEDYITDDPGHRHFSPLISLFPGNRIKFYNKQDTANLSYAKNLLDYRCANGSGTIGWSAMWAVCLYAKLHEPEKCLLYLNKMLSVIFPNMFDNCTPVIFQIDGNFGALEAINLMLAQSEDDIIELLPALPSEWENGEISGIVTQGGNILDVKWEKNIVTQLKIVNKNGKKIKLRDVNLSKNLIIDKNIELIENIK